MHVTLEELRANPPPPTSARDFQKARKWMIEGWLKDGFDPNVIAAAVNLTTQHIRRIRRDMELKEQLTRIEQKLDAALLAKLERNSEEAAISASVFDNGETSGAEWARYLAELHKSAA